MVRRRVVWKLRDLIIVLLSFIEEQSILQSNRRSIKQERFYCCTYISIAARIFRASATRPFRHNGVPGIEGLEYLREGVWSTCERGEGGGGVEYR